MASHGIKDRVAIVGMGCTAFGEHWDRSADDLLVETTEECFRTMQSFDKKSVDAYWLGTLSSGQSGLVLSQPLGLDYKPVTRVENFCATGSEAFRNACYAVACGAYDVVMAVGVEKLKDSGYAGLVSTRGTGDGTAPEATQTAPAAFSLLDPAYCKKHEVDPHAMRDAMTHVAWKTTPTAPRTRAPSSGPRCRRRRLRRRLGRSREDSGCSIAPEYLTELHAP